MPRSRASTSARCSTRVSCRAPWTAAWTNDRSDMMATAQADLRRKTGKSERRDPRGGERTPKDALRSLPATIAWLQREGLLMETDVPVSGDLELTGVQKHFDGSYPILFNNVKGYPHLRAITNLFANMDIVDRFFGYENATDRTRKLSHALTHPIPSEVVSQDEAACQQDVITDDLEVNKYILPIRHTHLESEITIGSGNSVVVGERFWGRSEEHTSELQSHHDLVCRLLLEKKNNENNNGVHSKSQVSATRLTTAPT